MNEQPLTACQERVLIAIIDLTRELGYSPCIREIGERCGIESPNGVLCHTQALIKKGWLAVTAATSRSWRVLRYPAECLPRYSVTRTAEGIRVTVPDRPLSADEVNDLATQLLLTVKEAR